MKTAKCPELDTSSVRALHERRAQGLALGAVLFERTNGGTRPTVEGQEFIESARRIVEDTGELMPRLKTRSRGESGRLTIGVQILRVDQGSMFSVN